MRKALLTLSIFFKRPSIIYRLLFIVIPFIVINSFIIPDMKFNLSSKHPKEFSIEELTELPKGEIPLYLRVKDAQVLRSSINAAETFHLKDTTLNSSLADLMKVEAYQYVLSQRVKNNDTTIAYIAYPVYSTKTISENPGKSANELPAWVVVKDSKYTKANEKNNDYFTDERFSIEGQYTPNEDPDVISELKNSGFQIQDNVIVLDKGKSAMKWPGLIFLTLLGIFFMTFSVLSFFPENKLREMFDDDYKA